MRLLFAVLVVTLALAAPVAANVYPEPTYDSGGEPHYDFTSNQNLFAVHTADVQGGDICILDGDTVDDGNLSCDSPAWGSKNHVGSSVGTGWTLIETPFLRTGTWVLLGDGPTADHISGPFTVHPCAPGACDTRIAEAVAAKYKAAAFNSAIAMLALKGMTALLTKINPTEPFAHFKNALNDALKKAAASSAIYMRIIAKEADKRLKPVTEAPDGPNSMALAILQNVVDGAFEMYMDIVNDPPADYAEVAEPVFELSPLTAGDALIDGMALDVAQMTGYGTAGRIAFERYQLAAAENNDLGVHRQSAAIAENNFALAENMYEAAGGFDSFADRLAADPEWAGAKIVQEHVDTLEPILARITASGFDATENADLDAAGFDATGKAELRAKLEDVPLDDVPIDKPFETLLRETATTLRTEAPAFDEMARVAESVAQSTNSAPQPGFTASTESGPPPLEVTFTSAASDPDTKDELTVTWDFGDGSPLETGDSAQHTFAEGTWTVTQTVSDGHLTATTSREITAATPNADPIAAFTATPQSGDAPLDVQFDATGSTDDGSIQSYDWDFGDSSPHESTATAQHTYTSAGNYLVTLTVTDDKGATDTEQTTITVTSAGNQPPTAAITATPDSGTEPLEVAFTGSGSNDPDGTIATYAWNFGDGATSTDADPVHTFAGGQHTVTLVVTDDKGATGTSQAVIEVNKKPLAAFTLSRTMGRVPLTVEMDAAPSSDADGAIVSYEWDFGDGATGTGKTTSHEYTQAGLYTVKLTVTDDKGATATSEQYVGPSDNVAPVAGFSASPDHGPAPLTVAFDDASSDQNGDPLTVSWDFGDGSTANGKHVEHTFDKGKWTVTQTVSDGLESATSTKQIISTATPVPSFTAAPQPGIAGQDVTFDASATSDPDGEIVEYAWNFGDGQAAESASPTASHAYVDGGVYTATLTVTDDLGETATLDKQIAVDGPPIAADDSLTLSGVDVLDVLANDQHPRDVAFQLHGHTQPAHGEATCDALGACRYVPDADYVGDDAFQYTIRDADGREDTATVVVYVVAEPDVTPALLARDDAVVTKAGQALAVSPLGNDAGAPPLIVVDTGDAKHGQADCTEAGACTYTPNAGYTGTDGFTYTVKDATDAERTAAVQVTVVPADAAFSPVAAGSPSAGDAVRQGETAEWSAGAGVSGENAALRALPLPQLTVQLTGEHAVEPDSVTTANGWSAGAPGRAPGAGLTAAPGPAAVLGDASSTALPRPLPPISQGTGGDGHVPILVGSKVFTTFHHKYPTALSCADRLTGALCPGYPKQLTVGAGDIPGPAVVIGSKFWVHLHPATGSVETGPIGLFCWDAATDATCGYEILGRARTENLVDGSHPVLTGGRIYVGAADDKLYCYDPEADATCGTLPLGLGATTAAPFYWDALANGSRVYVAGKGVGKVACVDVAAGQPCAGWSQPRSFDGRWNLVRRHDAGGDVTGMCVVGSNYGRCWDDATPDTVAAFDNWPVTDDFVNASLEAEAGTRTLIASHGTPGLVCWDWTTMATCGAPYDETGWLKTDTGGQPLPTGYGAAWDGSCAVAVGDPGEIYTVDPAGVAPCTSLGTGSEPQTFDLRDQRCDGTVGNATWKSADLLDTPASGPEAELKSFVVTVRDKQTGEVLLKQDLIGGAGQLDLSGIDPGDHPAITVEATAVSKAGDPAWSDGIPPRLRVSWNADPQQLCFQTRSAVACDDVKPIGISTALAGSAGTASKELPTLRSLTCNDAPVLELGENRTIDEQTALDTEVTASDPQGGSPSLQLLEGPEGLTLGGGRLKWTPTEAQGPGSYAVKVRATDDGTPAKTADDALTITVAEVNRRPEIEPPGPQSLQLGDTLAATARASDPDLPAQSLAFSIVSPVGPSIDAASGAISWKPAAPGNFPVTVRVTDSGTPPLSADATFAATVAAKDQGGDLLLCQTRDLVLEDVLIDGRNVELLGYADLRFAGQAVDIVYEVTGQIVARPTVLPDGRFRARLPLPPARQRSRARYVAKLGGESSLNLKLVRRMLVDDVQVAGRQVTISGRVIPPLARKRGDRSIEIRRRVSCGKDEVVGKATPKANGRFKVVLTAPADAAAVVYRFATKIRVSKRSRSATKTFTLPRVVVFSAG